MNLKEHITQLHIEINIEVVPRKEEKREEKLISIIENLKLSVLKPIMANMYSSRILYDFLSKFPLVQLNSDKYGFMFTIKKDSIIIDVFGSPLPELENLEKSLLTKQEKVDLSVLKYVNQTLTALYAAISSNVNKPVTPTQYLIGIVFNMEAEIISKLVNDIASVELSYPLKRVDISGVTFSLEVEETESPKKIKIDLRGSKYVFEKKFSSREIISIGEEVNKIINEASLFFTERKIPSHKGVS